MNKTNQLVGKQFQFQFTHLLQTVTCRLTIMSVRDGIVRARLPKSVMALPFPPAGRGANILLFAEEKITPIAR